MSGDAIFFFAVLAALMGMAYLGFFVGRLVGRMEEEARHIRSHEPKKSCDSKPPDVKQRPL